MSRLRNSSAALHPSLDQRHGCRIGELTNIDGKPGAKLGLLFLFITSIGSLQITTPLLYMTNVSARISDTFNLSLVKFYMSN